jgi:hypothetical protein
MHLVRRARSVVKTGIKIVFDLIEEIAKKLIAQRLNSVSSNLNPGTSSIIRKFGWEAWTTQGACKPLER